MLHPPMNGHMMNNGHPPSDLFIIKNIDPLTDVGRILSDLECLGYRVLSLDRATEAATGRPVSKFLVELFRTPFNKTILGVKCIANQTVFIKRFSQIKKPWNNYRTVPPSPYPEEYSCFPTCPRCNGPHSAWQCNSLTPPMAPNYCKCGRHHPPGYRGCHVYRQIFEANMEMLPVGPVIQTPAEDLPRLAVDDFQFEENASFVSSSDGVGSEADYSLLSSTQTPNTLDVELDYLKEHKKNMLDHYFSMHYQWRHLILKYSMDNK